MRTLPAPVTSFLSTRPDAVRVHTLVWITAKDRLTGIAESIGLWNGLDHQTFDIGGPRAYLGAGNILGLERITYASGLDVRMHEITFSALSPDIDQAIRAYDARLAPIEVHGLLIDPLTNAMIGAPWMALRGWIDEVIITTPSVGGEGSVSVKIASAARALTRTLSLKRGDASQQRRGGDRFRRYAEISGTGGDPWGET